MRNIISITLATLLIGCSGDNGPTTEQLKQSLTFELPGVFDIQSVSVELTENRGTETTPLIASKFQAEVSFKEDAFVKVDQIGETPVLKVKNPKGYTFNLYGLAISESSNGKWNTKFRFDQIRDFVPGELRIAFPSDAVIQGSKEEAALRVAIEKAQQEAHERAEQEKILARQQEAKDLEERVQKLKGIIATSKTYTGVLSYQGKGEPINVRISFQAAEDSTTKFTGRVEFIKQGETRTFSGEILQDQLYFLETSGGWPMKWEFKLDGDRLTGARMHRDNSGPEKGYILIPSA